MEARTGLVPRPRAISRATALRFVVLLGVVSLLADMTYEGARSVTGPYLAVLGASATVVGFVAGLGELIGYGLRLASGYLADRTRQYWTIAIVGYGINLLAVPLLALAGNWPVAAALIVAERIGKAVRSPAKDAILSHAAHQVGQGWGFGLHEALDQTGAVLGPLIVAGVLLVNGGYEAGFAVLLVPALLALAVLAAGRLLYPNPRDFEPRKLTLEGQGLPRVFWLYLAAVALIGAGYADFPLVAFHFQEARVASGDMIPVFYAVAMAVDAVAALVFGRWFDRSGISVLVVAALISALFAPLVFLGGFALAMVGAALWGVGMGAQESIMRAAVAQMVPSDRRAGAYGIFNTGYGVAWFLGSALMGLLYSVAIPSVIAFSMAMQFASIPLLLAISRRRMGAA